MTLLTYTGFNEVVEILSQVIRPFLSSEAILSNGTLASFPDLPHFMFFGLHSHESGRAAKMGKAWEHLSCEKCQVVIGGVGFHTLK